MKYKLELLINKPRVEVWRFFTDTEKAKLWQTSLQRVELLKGINGKSGTELKWTYEERGREFSLTEEVLSCEEPFRFESLFENEFASNTVVNEFIEQAERETFWIAETNYQFKTLLMKIMGPVLKKNYIARSQIEMERFREAVETG